MEGLLVLAAVSAESHIRRHAVDVFVTGGHFAETLASRMRCRTEGAGRHETVNSIQSLVVDTESEWCGYTFIVERGWRQFGATLARLR